MIRGATLSDLDDAVEIMVRASQGDPNYSYRFPGRRNYPDDFKDHCRVKFLEYITTCVVEVFEMPSIFNPEKSKIVAFSVWDIPSEYHIHPHMCASVQSQIAGYRPPERLANRSRATAFRQKCDVAKTNFFDSQLPEGHMFLKILLCHPDYQRLGAGTALTRQGIRRARAMGIHTTLFASPMGFTLYMKLGFREVGRFRVEIIGDKEYLDIPALVLESGIRST